MKASEIEWDDRQLSLGDLRELVGGTIKRVGYGPVDGFDYDTVMIEMTDGRTLYIAPWDYEGFSAGLNGIWDQPKGTPREGSQSPATEDDHLGGVHADGEFDPRDEHRDPR